MSPVHPSAAIGFQRGAADYERGRPSYPLTAVAVLQRELEIGPGRRVVDLAAGTGKLTRALVGLGADLVAVEPVPAMREQLRQAVPGVEVLDGTAESLPFADRSVDAIVVAQAFHWFDVEAAAAEIDRVLTVKGRLGVIRNAWNRSADWVDEMQALLGELRKGVPGQAGSKWRERLEQTGRFIPAGEATMPNPTQGDITTLLARIASVSFVATLDEAPRREVLDEVRGILERHGLGADGAVFAFPMRTHVVCWRRAGSSRSTP